ncbi:hypothetical protein L3X38_037005 [Prunus dulcis]|uniref:Uncharacterized protein n=1 Tax=Prunus dulcis TaxID=3755 RepID=A0AAD4V2V2_PRUDU|nr:hypothetical protein L3X38_037005 [Prunus dulcis]
MVARRSLRGGRIVGCSSALIFRGGPNSRRSMSLATFMFNLGMSCLSPFIRRWWRGVSWFFRSPPPNFLPILRSSLWRIHRLTGGGRGHIVR